MMKSVAIAGSLTLAALGAGLAPLAAGAPVVMTAGPVQAALGGDQAALELRLSYACTPGPCQQAVFTFGERREGQAERAEAPRYISA